VARLTRRAPARNVRRPTVSPRGVTCRLHTVKSDAWVASRVTIEQFPGIARLSSIVAPARKRKPMNKRAMNNRVVRVSRQRYVMKRVHWTSRETLLIPSSITHNAMPPEVKHV
jgi:hypothetical protein